MLLSRAPRAPQVFYDETDRSVNDTEVLVLALLLIRLVDQEKVQDWAEYVLAYSRGAVTASEAECQPRKLTSEFSECLQVITIERWTRTIDESKHATRASGLPPGRVVPGPLKAQVINQLADAKVKIKDLQNNARVMKNRATTARANLRATIDRRVAMDTAKHKDDAAAERNAACALLKEQFDKIGPWRSGSGSARRTRTPRACGSSRASSLRCGAITSSCAPKTRSTKTRSRRCARSSQCSSQSSTGCGSRRARATTATAAAVPSTGGTGSCT